jgi:hypothetical protein
MTIYVTVVGGGSRRCTSLAQANQVFNMLKRRGLVCFVEVKA